MGWLTRFELATTGITIQGSTNWAIATTTLLRFSVPLISIPDGTPERIRTFDLWLRWPTLYPAELRAYTLSAEKNNTDMRHLRLVFFLLFLSFGLFFYNSLLFILIFFGSSGLLQQFKQIYSLNIYTKLTLLLFKARFKIDKYYKMALGR